MARFMVRVVLHDAADDGRDYDKLHEAMERAGFGRTIRSDDGVTYHLPPAQYRLDAVSTVEEVRGLAFRAAGATGLKRGVFVSEVRCSAWQGLKQAKQAIGGLGGR